MARLSIIMPVLDEGEGIAGALDALAELRALGVEVIVVDGGSKDATVQRARLRADHVLLSPPGRALQMNAGAAKASGDVLLFLHADTRLPPEAERLVLDGLARSTHHWGRFDVMLPGGPHFALVAALMNVRSRLTGIATGDQAIFVARDAFREAGGYPPIPLMEDVALCKALLKRSRPLCLRDKVTASPRRWHKHGFLRTTVLMWRLRVEYFLGADPAELARRYGYAP